MFLQSSSSLLSHLPSQSLAVFFSFRATHPCRECQSWAGRHGSPPRCQNIWSRSGRVWCDCVPLRRCPGHRLGTVCFPEGHTAGRHPGHGYKRRRHHTDHLGFYHPAKGRSFHCSHSVCPWWQSKRPPQGYQLDTGHREDTERGLQMQKMFLKKKRFQNQHRCIS